MRSNFWLENKSQIRRALSLLISFSFLLGYVSPSQAVTSRSESITVYGSNGARYQGALVQIIYWDPKSPKGLEATTTLATTNALGQVSLSFPSDVVYAGVAVEPPTSDTQTAIYYQDIFESNAGVTFDIHLKSASMVIDIQGPDGKSLSPNDCVSVPTKIPGLNDQFRTTRSGPFGIYLDPLISTSIKNNSIGVYACSPSDFDLSGNEFRIRKNIDTSFTVFTDYFGAKVLAPENGVYNLKLPAAVVTGQINDTNGLPLDNSENRVQLTGFPILSNGDIDPTNGWDWGSISKNGKWGFFKYFGQPGNYEIRVSDLSTNPRPSFVAGRYSIDDYGKVSLTENGTFSKELFMTATVPTTNILKFLVHDGGPAVAVGGTVQIQRKQSDSTWAQYFDAGIGLTGFASMKLADGEYKLTANPAHNGTPLSDYYVSVSGGSATVKDSSTAIVALTSDYYSLGSQTSTLQIQPISSIDSSMLHMNVEIDQNLDGSGGYVSNTYLDTTTATAKFNLADGKYQIRLTPDWLTLGDWTTTTYKLTVISGIATVQSDSGTVSTTGGVYKLPVKKAFFSGTVFDSNGTDFVRFSQVIATNVANNSIIYYGNTDVMGHYTLDFSAPLKPGLYSIQAIPDPYHAAGQGSSKPVLETITTSAQPINLDLHLRAANVIGTVTGPRGVSPNNSVTITNKDSSGVTKTSSIYPQTNKTGNFYIYLDPDTYTLTTNPDLTSAGGGAGNTTCLVASDTRTVNTCDISLPAPNVSGSVTVGGIAPENLQIGLFPSLSVTGNKWQWNYQNNPWTGFSGDNTYKNAMNPGTYRMWINYINKENENVTIPGPLCVVPTTGSVNCSATLPATNFKFRVTDKNGIPLPSATVGIQYKENNGYFWTCCNAITQETMTVPLIDGSYIASVLNPNDITKGLAQDYYFTVTSGVLSNVHLQDAIDSVAPVDGIYTLSAKSPALSGVVFQPDGVTPAAGISISLDGGAKFGVMQWITSTDSKGRFAVDLSFMGTKFDGAYKLQALPRQGAFGSSQWTSFTVTSNQGPSDLTLVLRRPNVFGTISGPKAASPNAYVSVIQVDSYGRYNYLGGLTTDDKGKFSAAFDIGKYLLSTDGNYQITGGTSVQDVPCNVALDSPTVTTCNISLLAPNTVGTVTQGGTPLYYGSLYSSPDYSVSPNKAVSAQNGKGSPPSWATIGSDGTYALYSSPGTYFSSIGSSNNSGYLFAPGDNCVVSEDTSTINTCNVALPATNFEFNVIGLDGKPANTSIYPNLWRVKSDKYWLGTSGGQSWDGSSFKYNLLDGTYRLQIGVNDSSKGIGKNYSLTISGGIVTNFKVVDSTTAISSVGGIYTLDLKQPSLQGFVVEPDGVTRASNFQVLATGPLNGNSQTWWGNQYGQGDFNLNLGDVQSPGVYKLQAIPYGGDNHGSSAVVYETLTSSNFITGIKLTLRTPNVSGLVSGVKGASPGNWLNIQKLLDNGAWEYLQYGVNTDDSGHFYLSLDPGKYKFTAQSDLVNAGGAATTSGICEVLNGVNKVCDFSLKAPNLYGAVRNSGVAVQGWMNLFQVTSQGIVWTNNNSGTDRDGNFAFFVAPGKYRSIIYDYRNGTSFFGPECSVTDTPTACNIDIPDVNLKVKVLDSTKHNQVSYGGASLGLLVNGYQQLGVWVQNSGTDSTTELHGELADGSYQLDVWPRNQQDGAARSFKVTVSGGAVTLLQATDTLETFTATAGLFTVGLTPPSIAGTVVAPDGTTPVPNSEVNAFASGDKGCCYQGGGYSDDSGYFAFARMPDGQYTLIARAPWQDATKGDSLPSKVTVTNGSSNTSMKLQLQVPNVTGVVRGPRGVSPGNWVQVQHKLANGSWEWPQFVRSTNTTNNGDFAFALPTGTYRFLAGGDPSNSGGGPGMSNWCDVPATGAIQCNITLATPNLKFAITAPGSSANLSNTWGYVNYSGGGNNVANYSPQISWNSDNYFESSLEDGIWSLVVQPAYDATQYAPKTYRITVSGGVISQIVDMNNISATPIGGLYFLSLDGVNLTGTVMAGASPYTYGASINLLTYSGKGYWYSQGTWSWNGTFGFKVAPGTYRIEVTPYNGYGDAANYTKSRSEDCVVAATGSTSCDVTLAIPNLSAVVKTQSGDIYKYCYIWLNSTDTSGNYSYQYIGLTGDGTFSTHLYDGKYDLQVAPYWDQRSLYSERDYKVIVSGGVITSFVIAASGVPTPSSNGIYTLTVATPSMAGTVLTPGENPVGVANVQVLVAPPGSYGNWRFSTSTDSSGKFGLTVPDGTYVVQAVPWNGQLGFGKSETKTVVIASQVLSETLTLTLRNPNFTGTIVQPGTTSPVIGVNVNAWIGNEYFYAYTGEDGKFSFFVDSTNPNCPSNCWIDLNPSQGADFTHRSFRPNTLGSMGNIELGSVNTRITVKAPKSDATLVPNRYGYVSVMLVDTVTSKSYYVAGGNTNDLGVTGFSLEEGKHYVITANPAGENNGLFSPKTIEVASFSASSNASISINFDLPNLVINSRGSDLFTNPYGWWTLNNNYDSVTGTSSFLQNGYLNDLGVSSLTLSDGSYKITIHPGKASGVDRIYAFKMVSGVPSLIANGLGTLNPNESISGKNLNMVLGSGNISGYTQNSSGTVIGNSLVSASRVDSPSTKVTVTSDKLGFYQMNLDTSYDWNIKAVDPQTLSSGTRSLTHQGSSNTILSAQNISMS
jgi:hypothetical protein